MNKWKKLTKERKTGARKRRNKAEKDKLIKKKHRTKEINNKYKSTKNI